MNHRIQSAEKHACLLVESGPLMFVASSLRTKPMACIQVFNGGYTSSVRRACRRTEGRHGKLMLASALGIACPQEAFFVEVELLADEGHGCVLAPRQSRLSAAFSDPVEPPENQVTGRSDVQSGSALGESKSSWCRGKGPAVIGQAQTPFSTTRFSWTGMPFA